MYLFIEFKYYILTNVMIIILISDETDNILCNRHDRSFFDDKISSYIFVILNVIKEMTLEPSLKYQLIFN